MSQSCKASFSEETPSPYWQCSNIYLFSLEGRPKVTAASKRESSAGSRSWRRLVAPTTMLRLCGPKPSSCLSSTPSSRRVASCISELQSTLPSEGCYPVRWSVETLAASAAAVVLPRDC